SALDVVRKHPDLFRVAALAGGKNATLLAQQAAIFRPKVLAVFDEPTAATLKAALPTGYTPTILTGPEGYQTLAALDGVDLVLSAIVGAAGFLPTLTAARAGKLIALANKESLVLGGGLIRKACQASGAIILPVDSEHNALFQGLAGHGGHGLKKLILTASGGPFHGKNLDFLSKVTRKQALKHPNWDMGAKISIDSATLMNKGLEVIEACHLYGLPVDLIDVVVHPQSIVHSLVEYVDGSQLAHLGAPDMRIPIAHCLCYPDRVNVGLPSLSLAEVGSLTFERPDLTAFPCLRLAMEAFAAGPSHPIVLNGANEVAVDLFLHDAIRFLDIPALIGDTLEQHTPVDVSTPEAILALDHQTRETARAWARKNAS
ncbi:MAG: 1-deoxy-D-xylulose-5-phosphate reductoisomerase, partial [Proteobacteria bacterium]|nr:1-deoxy-D-xylulose-5-phosphate reductoisomerase [Pseudomonadota bacterium]